MPVTATRTKLTVRTPMRRLNALPMNMSTMPTSRMSTVGTMTR